MAKISLEIAVLVAGVAALILSAITLGSLEKLKTAAEAADKKAFEAARGSQIAQIVISSLVIILSGIVVFGGTKGAGIKSYAGKIFG